MAGQTTLLKKVTEGSLHISQSDKDKKIVVMDLETYHKMAVKHTLKDTEVSWKELDHAQRDLRAHSRALGPDLQARTQQQEQSQVF